jgi:hypothetical protein
MPQIKTFKGALKNASTESAHKCILCTSVGRLVLEHAEEHVVAVQVIVPSRGRADDHQHARGAATPARLSHTIGKMVAAVPPNSVVRRHTAKISLSCDRSTMHGNETAHSKGVLPCTAKEPLPCAY